MRGRAPHGHTISKDHARRWQDSLHTPAPTADPAHATTSFFSQLLFEISRCPRLPLRRKTLRRNHAGATVPRLVVADPHSATARGATANATALPLHRSLPQARRAPLAPQAAAPPLECT